MRSVIQLGCLGAAALLIMTGCETEDSGESTITESEFLESFEEIYCGNYSTCLPDATCPPVSEVLDTTCVYDGGYAPDCLAGDFSCEEDALIVPTLCAAVFDCDATGGTTTGGGTTPTGTYPTGTTSEP
jgi:hypothetical protein